MALDPLLAPMLAAAKRAVPPRPITHHARRASAAEGVERAWEAYGLPISQVAVQLATVAVDNGPDANIRIYRPLDATKALPAVVTFFGGAFQQGGNDSSPNRWMHAQRAIDAGVAVVAVDYALAPEHRFPIAIEQGLAVLAHLVADGDDLGIDTTRLAVGGQSSGACIAACVAQWNLDRDALPLRLQLLEVPVLDLTGGHLDFAALRGLGIPKLLLRRDRAQVARTYLGTARHASDPTASPLLRRDLRGLPEAHILASEHDPLRGDAAAYHRRLRDAGVRSSATVALGQTHDSVGMVGSLLAARHWHGAATGALRTLHS